MIYLRLITVRSVVAHTGYVGPSCRVCAALVASLMTAAYWLRNAPQRTFSICIPATEVNRSTCMWHVACHDVSFSQLSKNEGFSQLSHEHTKLRVVKSFASSHHDVCNPSPVTSCGRQQRPCVCLVQQHSSSKGNWRQQEG